MKIELIAVGAKMPSWVEEGIREYRKRLPENFKLIVTKIPLARRSRAGGNMDVIREKEGRALLSALGRNQYVIALDVKGKTHTTQQLAKKVDIIRQEGRDITMLAGGPDGLSPECLARADEIWSLSALTLPHSIVRMVVAEQVYRIWSVLNGHPYHRN